MTDIASPPSAPRADYLHDGSTLASWLFTTDHKRIAILFTISITFFFFLAAVAIGIVRLELLRPNGGLVSDDTYNKLFTFHGIVMVWFFLVPSIPTTLGNFLLPLMIGAKDLAFPRLNLFSWYLYLGGALFTLVTLISGGVDTGWTFYTPYSTMFSNTSVLSATAGVLVVGFSSVFTGINFIATSHMLRAPGMTWFRLPLFVWAMYATSLVMILATPVLAMTLILIMAERWFRPGRSSTPARTAAIRCCFNICSRSTAIRPSTSWCYRRWASCPKLSRASRGGVSSVIPSCVRPDGARNHRLLRVGPPHVRLRACRPMRASCSHSSLSWSPFPLQSKSSNWTATLYRGSITFEAPMLLCAQLHRLVYDRRADGPLPCHHSDRRSRDRHVFR